MDKLDMERALGAEGYPFVAGVDEVGRGPLAGPVVAAAVILPLDADFTGVNDSKKLSAKKREALAAYIKEHALSYSIFEVDEKTIDRINIREATRLAMKGAVEGLSLQPSLVLSDGDLTLDLAKVYRDALMAEYAKLYPEYAFERNAGYGTAAHINAIREVGICPIHRRTFVTKFWDGRERP